jgi:hypothetical protein
MAKPLTEDLILMRTKAGNLELIKNLNLWGNEIDDVSVLKEMPNIEVLSLSVNRISTLKPFQYCKKLTELYLRKNLISDLSELRYLQNLPSLKVLWLWENPCAESSNYREKVLALLPNLVKLDNQAVTNEEKNQAAKFDGPRPRGKENEVAANKRDRNASPVVKEAPRINRIRGDLSTEERNVSPAVREPVKQPARPRAEEGRSNNILCAVLALIKDLDEYNLEIVKKEIEKKIRDR